MKPFLLANDSADGKAIVIGIIILIVLLLLIGLFGMLVRYIFLRQGERSEASMANVVYAHVVNSTKEYRRLASKKNNRALFKDSLIPFAIALIGILIWTFENIATQNWGANIFSDFAELFFWFDWNAPGVIVKVFFLPLIGSFPPVSHNPEFHLEHLCHYLEVFLFIVSWAWAAIACQGYIARFFNIRARSKSIFTVSLKDYKAMGDIKIAPEKPIGPTE